MQNTDKAMFKKALETCFANYREPAPLEAVIDDWLRCLAPYTIMQVGNAIEHHKRNSRFAPFIADIQALLPKDPSDWPDSSIAFGEMLRVESGSFMLVTKEHIAAFEAGRPLLEIRDRFNASKAFAERYEAMVTAAKNAGAHAAWFVSNSGSDHDGMYRREALREGARIKRITFEQGRTLSLLLPPEPDKIPEHGADGRLPALPAPARSDRAKSEIEKLRAALKPDYSKNVVRAMAPDMAATRDLKAESARKLAEHQAAQSLKATLAERDAEIAALRAALAANGGA
jgi:hypothetical protein